MNIKQKLLTSIDVYDPGAGLSVDAALREKYVPALFSNALLERQSVCGWAALCVRRIARIDGEERWKAIFRSAVQGLSEEEKGRYIGAKGAAFYRFRASLEGGKDARLFFPAPLCAVASRGSGGREEILSHSLLGKGEASGASAATLIGMLGGRGDAELREVLPRVFKHSPSKKLEDALKLYEVMQGEIGKKSRDALFSRCEECSAALAKGETLLLMGKIPKVPPSIHIGDNAGFAALLRNDGKADESVEKWIKASSHPLKQALVDSPALQALQKALEMRDQLLAEALSKNGIDWWKEPKPFLEAKIRQMAANCALCALPDLTSLLQQYLKADALEELLVLLKEDDARFADALVSRAGSAAQKAVSSARDAVLDVAMEAGEALPPIATAVFEQLGYGHFGRQEQPLWLEIEQGEKGNFTVNLHFVGRGVLDHQVEGKGYQSVFRFKDIPREKLNPEFFYLFYSFQAYGEWQKQIYDTEEVIAKLSLFLGKTPLEPASDTASDSAHLVSGPWGMVQEYALKNDQATLFKLKFEAYCELFQQLSASKILLSRSDFLEERAQGLIDEMGALLRSRRMSFEELKTCFATLQDALWRLEALKERREGEIPQVIPKDLQEWANALFTAIGVTPFRVSLIKDLLIDHLGEEARGTVERLCAAVEKEAGPFEEIPEPHFNWKALDRQWTVFRVARTALCLLISPLAYAVHVTKSVALKAFSHYFPEGEKKLLRFKARLFAKMILPLLFTKEQLKEFQRVLAGVEGELLHTQELSFALRGQGQGPLKTLKVNREGVALGTTALSETKQSGFVESEEEVPLTPQNITARLKKWQADVLSLRYSVQSRYLDEKLALLPLALNHFWNGVEEKEIEECLTALGETALLISKMTGRRERERENHLIVHQFSLYAICDKLARRCKTSGLHGFQVNPYGFITWHNKFSARLLDSRIQERYEQNCRYFGIDSSANYTEDVIESRLKKCLFNEPSDRRITQSFFHSQDGLYVRKLLKDPAIQMRLKQKGIEGEIDQLTMLYVNPTLKGGENQQEKFLEMMGDFSTLVKWNEGSEFKEVNKQLHEGLAWLEQNRDTLLEGLNQRGYSGLLPFPDFIVRQVHEISNRMLARDKEPISDIFESTIEYHGQVHFVHRWVNDAYRYFTGKSFFDPLIDSKSIFNNLWGNVRWISGNLTNAAYETSDPAVEVEEEVIQTACKKLNLKAQHLILNEENRVFEWLKGEAGQKLGEMIFTDPQDRPARVLAFFTENRQLFKDRKSLVLLHLALLKGSDLRNQLKTEPEFFQVLKRFFADNIAYLVEQEKVAESRELFRLAVLVQLEIETMGGFEEPLFDFAKMVQLLSKNASQTELAEFHSLAGLRYALQNPQKLAREKQREGVRDLLLADFHNGSGNDEFNQTYCAWVKTMEKTLLEDEALRDEMLARFTALKGINIGLSNEPWEGSYPCYHKGKLRVNLATGGANFNALDWERNIKNALLPAFPELSNTRLRHKEGGVFEFAFYNSPWRPLNFQVVPDPVKGNCRFYLTEKGKRFKWVAVEGEPEVSYWLEEGGEGQLLKYQEGQFVARYRVKRDLQAKSIDLLSELKEYKGEWLEDQPLESLSEGLQPLAWFCPLAEIRGFTEIGNPRQLKLIELPKMGLTFEIEEGRAYANGAYAGYYLAKTQKDAALSPFANYLLLQNDAGEKKILLPKKTILNAFSSRLLNFLGIYSSSQFLNSLSLQVEHLNLEGYYAFDLDAEGSLSSSDSGAMAHLVAHHLAKREFPEAERILKKLEGMGKRMPLSCQVHELSVLIGAVAALFQEPRANLISLRMAALVQESRGLHPIGRGLNTFYLLLHNVVLQKNYLSYLDQKRAYPSLTPHQELFLIEAMEHSCRFFSQEFQRRVGGIVDQAEIAGFLSEGVSAFLIHPRIGERAKELLEKNAPQLVAMQPFWKKVFQNYFAGEKGDAGQTKKGMFHLLDLIRGALGHVLNKRELQEGFDRCSLEIISQDKLPVDYSQLTLETIGREFLSYYALVRNELKAPEKRADFLKSLELLKNSKGGGETLLNFLEMVAEDPVPYPSSKEVQQELQINRSPKPSKASEVSEAPKAANVPRAPGAARPFRPSPPKEQILANEAFEKEKMKWGEKVKYLEQLKRQLLLIRGRANNYLVSGNPFLIKLENTLDKIRELIRHAEEKRDARPPFSLPTIPAISWEQMSAPLFNARFQMSLPHEPASEPPKIVALGKIWELCSSTKRQKQFLEPLKKLAGTYGSSLLKTAGISYVTSKAFSFIGYQRAELAAWVGKLGWSIAKAMGEQHQYTPEKKMADAPNPQWSSELQEEDEQIGKRLQSLAEAFFPRSKAQANPPCAPLECRDPVSAAYVARLNQSLKDYEKREKPEMVWSGAAAVDDLYRLAEQLKGAAQDLSTALETEKNALLGYVNQSPPSSMNNEDALLEAMAHTKRETVDFDTLLECFLYRDTSLLQAKTGLSRGEVEGVFQRIGRYLILETRRKQCRRVAGQIDEANQMPRDSIQYQLQIRTIAENLAARRSYKIDGASGRLARAFMIFEAKTGMMLWAKQVAKLEKMLLGKERREVCELLMGSGKTSLCIPVTDIYVADGSQIAINIFLKALANTNIGDTASQAEGTFYQDAYEIHFNRKQRLSPEQLKGRLLSFLRAITEGSQINSCKEDLQALELIWIEEIFNKSSSDNLTLMTEILRLIRFYGKPNFDEVQEILRRDNQLNHPLGPKHHLDHNYVRVTEEFVRQLLTEEEVGLKANQQAFMSEDTYEKKVKPRLAEKMAASKVFKENDNPSVVAYLTSAASTFRSGVSRSLLGLARGLIGLIGPKSLTKIVNVHYGPSKADEKGYAKPYRGNNECVEEADIQNPHEACLKTFLQQIVNRMTPSQIAELIGKLKASAKREADSEGIDFNQTKAARLFHKWCKRKYDLRHLGDMKEIGELLNAQDEAVLLHARLFIAPEITYYKLNLCSNSQNFASMFPGFRAYSATPTNYETYPVDTKVHFDDGTMGEAIDLLVKMCSTKESIVQIASETPREALQKVLNETIKPGVTKALVDCGALWRGIPNSEVAKKVEAHLREHDKSVTSLVYYNEDKVLMEKTFKAGKLDKFQKVKETEKGRFAYFGHPHITGADIPLNEVAEGYVTLGEDTTLTQLTQAMGRLRLTKRGKQTFRILLTEKTKKLIAGDEECTIVKILEFVILNEAKKMIEDNFLADKQKIADLIRRAVLDKLLLAGSHQEMFRIFEKYKNVIVNSAQDDPFLLYGLPQEWMNPEKVLEKMKKSCLSLLNDTGENPVFTDEEIQNLTAELEKVGKGRYPKEVQVFIGGEQLLWNLGSDIGQEQQVEHNVNQNQENQVQQDIEFEQDLVRSPPPASNAPTLLPPKPWDPDADYFASLDWLKPSPLAASWGKKVGIFTLADALQSAAMPRLAKMAPAFAGPIYCTENFIGRTRSLYIFETLATPFANRQKPLQEVLILKEKGRHSLLIVDADDAHFWRAQLEKQRNSGQENPDLQIALYDLSLKTLVSGSKRGFEVPPELQDDLTRLKFLKGSVVYDDDEQQSLRPWLAEKGVGKLKELFFDIHSRFGVAPMNGSSLDILFEDSIW